MRSLLVATLAAGTLFACGNPSETSSSELAAVNSKESSKYAQTLTYRVSFLGRTSEGSVFISDANRGQVVIRDLVGNQTGDLGIELLENGVPKYRGVISQLTLQNVAQNRQSLNLLAVSNVVQPQTIASQDVGDILGEEGLLEDTEGAEYCGPGGKIRFDDRFFNSRFDSRFDSRFGSGFDSGVFVGSRIELLLDVTVPGVPPR